MYALQLTVLFHGRLQRLTHRRFRLLDTPLALRLARSELCGETVESTGRRSQVFWCLFQKPPPFRPADRAYGFGTDDRVYHPVHRGEQRQVLPDHIGWDLHRLPFRFRCRSRNRFRTILLVDSPHDIGGRRFDLPNRRISYLTDVLVDLIGTFLHPESSEDRRRMEERRSESVVELIEGPLRDRVVDLYGLFDGRIGTGLSFILRFPISHLPSLLRLRALSPVARFGGAARLHLGF